VFRMIRFACENEPDFSIMCSRKNCNALETDLAAGTTHP
jgi:hypothetical protein